MLEPKVTGISTSHDRVITVPGVRTVSATAVKIQPMPIANRLSSTTATSMEVTPPAPRKPMTKPTASTKAAEAV